jgi:hypothetical protein
MASRAHRKISSGGPADFEILERYLGGDENLFGGLKISSSAEVATVIRNP